MRYLPGEMSLWCYQQKIARIRHFKGIIMNNVRLPEGLDKEFCPGSRHITISSINFVIERSLRYEDDKSHY